MVMTVMTRGAKGQRLPADPLEAIDRHWQRGRRGRGWMTLPHPGRPLLDMALRSMLGEPVDAAAVVIVDDDDRREERMTRLK